MPQNMLKNQSGNRACANTASGFTLIEVLLYTGIVATTISLITALLLNTFEARAQHEAVMEIENNGATSLGIITQLIRNAREITVPLPGETGETLTLVTNDTPPRTFTIRSNNELLTIQEDPGIPVALTSSRLITSGLMFTNTTTGAMPGNVQLQFTLAPMFVDHSFYQVYSKNFYASASLRDN